MIFKFLIYSAIFTTYILFKTDNPIEGTIVVFLNLTIAQHFIMYEEKELIHIKKKIKRKEMNKKEIKEIDLTKMTLDIFLPKYICFVWNGLHYNSVSIYNKGVLDYIFNNNERVYIMRLKDKKIYKDINKFLKGNKLL